MALKVINSENKSTYFSTQVGSHQKCMFPQNEYPSVEAYYGPYESKEFAHSCLVERFGSSEDIPQGLTIAVVEQGKIVEYQYVDATPASGYTVANLIKKGGSTVVNNLESDSTTDALSAKQGKELKGMIEAKDGADPEVIKEAVNTYLAENPLGNAEDIAYGEDSNVGAELDKIFGATKTESIPLGEKISGSYYNKEGSITDSSGIRYEKVNIDSKYSDITIKVTDLTSPGARCTCFYSGDTLVKAVEERSYTLDGTTYVYTSPTKISGKIIDAVAMSFKAGNATISGTYTVDKDFYNKVETNNLISNIRGEINSSPIQPHIVPTPPYNIYRNPQGKYFADNTIDKIFDKSSDIIEYYVDSVNGADGSGRGLDASKPFKTILAALTAYRENGKTNTIINITDGSVFYHSDLYAVASGLLVHGNLAIICKGECKCIAGKPNVFTQYADKQGIYYYNESTSLIIRGAVDVSESNIDDYDLYSPMIPVNSMDDLESTQNSYYRPDTQNIYINIGDKDVNNYIAMTDKYALRLASLHSSYEGDVKIYIEGVNFVGTFLANINKSTYNHELHVTRCKFQHNMPNNNTSGGNCMASANYTYTYVTDCVAGYCVADCFNYHAASMDREKAMNETLIVELNCSAKYAGYYHAGENSNNLSTSHEGMNSIRCGTRGYGCEGSAIGDANGCHAVYIDCEVYTDWRILVRSQAISNTLNGSSVSSYRPCESIVQNCKAYSNIGNNGVHIEVGSDRVGEGEDDGVVWLANQDYESVYCVDKRVLSRPL